MRLYVALSFIFFLLGLDFLFHVDKLLLAVVEFILQESHFLRGNDVYTESVFHLPLPFQGHDALVDIGSYVWVHMKIEFLDTNLVDQIVNLTLQLVCEKDA